MSYKSIGLLALLTTVGATPGLAVMVPNGTVSGVGTFNPVVNVTSDPSTYTATNGGTIEISGSGGFAAVTGGTGTMNGMLTFSSTVGTTIAQSLANFFVFSDGMGGQYNYSVQSVTTNAFVNQPNIATSSTLYLLGTIVDAMRGFDTATASSLTVQFNSTGGSPFATSLSLSVPPAGSVVPEPASWAMMIAGFGVVGVTMRRRRRARITFG